MNLSEMRHVLAGRGIKLTRSLGQNFMHDHNQLRRIVNAADLRPDDKILEIGPGLGPLTCQLLEKTKHVLAIEKDRRLFEYLQESHENDDRLDLLHEDALEFLRRSGRDWTDWKMVSNLPFSVASPILVELARPASAPRLIVATVQLEVGRRITAGPGEEDYGLLTLMLGLCFEVSGWFKIPAGCFFPAPDVDSACVTLLRREKPLLETWQQERFVKIVKRSFTQRRKMVMKLLKADWPPEELESAFQQLNIRFEERAERLSLDQFVSLTQSLREITPNHER